MIMRRFPALLPRSAVVAAGVTALSVSMIVMTGPTAATATAATAALDQDVARTLASYAGPSGFADSSSTTSCVGGPNPPWLAYRTDGIMLRTDRTPSSIRAVVADALDGTLPGEPTIAAAVGTPEIITWPGDGVRPLVHVPLTGAGGTAVPVVDLARRVNRLDVVASPNYLFSPSGSVGMWPNGYPVPTSQPTPTRSDPTLGSGVTAFLYDTGVPPLGQHTVVPGLSRLSGADTEQPDAIAPFGTADRYYTGHTVAIAGTLHALAPGATIKAARITGSDGVPTDLTAARRIADTLRRAVSSSTWPDVMLAAFGSPACDLDPGAAATDEMVPLGLQAAVEVTAQYGQSVFLASSGNRGTARRFYPAAFGPVVSVGALDATGDGDGSAWTSPSRAGAAADFSNFGASVDVWAPGVALAVPHVTGLRFETNGRVIEGQAIVDGTSFAAPYAAGLVAEIIGRHPTWSPQSVVTTLVGSGRPCSAGLGSGTAVALTSLLVPATSPATGPLPSCQGRP